MQRVPGSGREHLGTTWPRRGALLHRSMGSAWESHQSPQRPPTPPGWMRPLPVHLYSMGYWLSDLEPVGRWCPVTTLVTEVGRAGCWEQGREEPGLAARPSTLLGEPPLKVEHLQRVRLIRRQWGWSSMRITGVYPASPSRQSGSILAPKSLWIQNCFRRGQQDSGVRADRLQPSAKPESPTGEKGREKTQPPPKTDRF